MRYLGIVLMAVAISACGVSEDDVKELHTQQRQILAKLRDLDKKLEQMGGARQARARQQPDPNKAYDIPVGKSAIRGPEKAPVTIVEFSDYQCPYCSRSEPLIQSVLRSYPDRVRLVFKNLPLPMHPHAMDAAKAAVAAGMQGKYWEMHDKLFANQSALAADNLKQYAGAIGVDVDRWEKDFRSPEVEAIVKDDMRAASSAAVRGTPTFFVNGKRLQARSESGFKAMIDAALAEKKAG